MERKDIQPYIERIEQIDQVLQKPIETLTYVVYEDLFPSVDGRDRRSPRATSNRSEQGPRAEYHFPAVLADGFAHPAAATLSHAICCNTIQRVWGIRRRFPHMKAAWERLDELARRARTGLNSALADPFAPAEPYKALQNLDGGDLDPLTASQVFWVLLYAGEDRLHSPLGFTAFFSLVKALALRYPPQDADGVSMPGSRPSAWVTAKVIAPLATLVGICRRRASLFVEAREILEALSKQVEAKRTARPGAARRRAEIKMKAKAPLLLERLAIVAEELSEIAIARKAFTDLVTDLDERLNQEHWDGELDDDAWQDILKKFREAVANVGKETEQVMKAVSKVTRGSSDSGSDRGESGDDGPLLDRLVRGYQNAGAEGALSGLPDALRIEPVSAPPLTRKALLDFRQRETEAVTAAAKVTGDAFDALLNASSLVKSTLALSDEKRADEMETLEEAFRQLAEANERVADLVSEQMNDAVHWCEAVMTRQLSYASAQNWTEFDPGELISSMHVLVSRGRLTSDLSIRAAIRQSLLGRRDDGSWHGGQPFWTRHGMGMFPPTSDILWMLSDTLSRHPDIDIADGALGDYVAWLERTLHSVQHGSYKDGSQERPLDRRTLYGWASDRDHHSGIDLWATAFAINALLGIRDLMEFRLLKLCERRFTFSGSRNRLEDIDPVDVGTPYPRRLHRGLYGVARDTIGKTYDKAAYSVVLHGPPGSSKTALIEALSNEMWRRAGRSLARPRLIRITPADFTRMGEDRLDSEAAFIFELLASVRGVTILFDEVDDLLRRRSASRQLRFIELVTPAMLNRLQDLRDVCARQEIVFLFATNYVERIEGALLRPGRIDRRLPVVYPDVLSREWMFVKSTEGLWREPESPAPSDAVQREKLRDLYFSCVSKLGEDIEYRPWKSLYETLGNLAGLFERHVSKNETALLEAASRYDEGTRVPVLDKLREEMREASREELNNPQIREYERGRIKLLPKSPELENELLTVAVSEASDLEFFGKELGKLCGKKTGEGEDGDAAGRVPQLFTEEKVQRFWNLVRPSREHSA